MHRYQARISWSRAGAAFVDNRYSRAHQWSFDGGARVSASASPQIVPAPFSVAEHVDPEEALIAAASSCHMLWFLSLAADRGWLVERYVDDAVGVMGKNEQGRLAITRITLRPQIEFGGSMAPTDSELATMHEAAHQRCFIANSLRSQIVIEPASA